MKKILLIPALLLGSLAIADDYKYEISPMVGYNVAEGNLGMKDDGYFVGGLEAQANTVGSKWSPELSVFGTKNADYKGLGNIDTDILRVAFNGVYTFDEMSSMVPFAKLGAGYETVNNEVLSNQDGFFADAGAGVKVPLTEAIALKLEGIYMAKLGGNNAGNADSNFMALAGLSFSFGKVAQAAPAVVAPVVVDGDDDKDGVLNSVDQCIYTPEGTPVNAQGCALDDDKDGVSNNLDQCLETPFGEEVDAKGCSLDDDRDGVVNAKDQCLKTPIGVVVNSDGCMKTINLHVNFDHDSAVVRKDQMKEINAYANFLTTYTNYNSKIVGYTDSLGSDAYNQKLSERRAESVKNVLIQEGVDASRLTSAGMGEANPVADNSTKEGRAQNRRIEAEMTLK